MKKRILKLLLSAMIIGGMLAGCASDNKVEAKQNNAARVQSEDKENKNSEASKPQDIYVFLAASLKNTMEEIKIDYEKEHPDVNIIYNADSSGTLQTQIEEGAQCDIFFSAATKQMDALAEEGLIAKDSISNLLQNKIVLIKSKGEKTAVTGFEDITNAASIALAGEDVPVGQYARALFKNLGILEQVMEMEINEGANVTAVLTAVAEASNEVGVVYATDAASMPDAVEVLAEAPADQVDSAIYPVGLVNCELSSDEDVEAAEAFKNYLTEDEGVMEKFVKAGFKEYTES